MTLSLFRVGILTNQHKRDHKQLVQILHRSCVNKNVLDVVANLLSCLCSKIHCKSVPTSSDSSCISVHPIIRSMFELLFQFLNSSFRNLPNLYRSPFFSSTPASRSHLQVPNRHAPICPTTILAVHPRPLFSSAPINLLILQCPSAACQLPQSLISFY